MLSGVCGEDGSSYGFTRVHFSAPSGVRLPPLAITTIEPSICAVADVMPGCAAMAAARNCATLVVLVKSVPTTLVTVTPFSVNDHVSPSSNVLG